MLAGTAAGATGVAYDGDGDDGGGALNTSHPPPLEEPPLGAEGPSAMSTAMDAEAEADPPHERLSIRSVRSSSVAASLGAGGLPNAWAGPARQIERRTPRPPATGAKFRTTPPEEEEEEVVVAPPTASPSSAMRSMEGRRWRLGGLVLLLPPPPPPPLPPPSSLLPNLRCCRRSTSGFSLGCCT